MLGRLGLIATYLAAGLISGAAHAQTGDPAALRGAAQALSAKIDAAARGGKMPPRLNDPDGLVRNGLDRAAIRALPNDLPLMLASCQSVIGVVTSYLGYTTKRPDGSPLDPVVQRQRELVVQDESMLGVAAIDLCSKRMLVAATALTATLTPAQRRDPARIKGAAQMRNGMAQLLAGTVDAQTDLNLRPGNVALLRESTLEMAEAGADAMTLEQRANMRAKIDAAIKAAPANGAAMLRRLRTIYTRTSCTGLCAFN